MAQTENFPAQLAQTAQLLSGRVRPLSIAALTLVGFAALLRTTALVHLAFLSGAGLLAAFAALVALLGRTCPRRAMGVPGLYGASQHLCDTSGVGASLSGEAAPQGLPMLTIALDGEVLYANRAVTLLLGGPARRIEQVFHDLPVCSGAVQRLRGRDGPVNVRVREAQGTGGRREFFLERLRDGEIAHQPDARFFDDLPVALVKLSAEGRVLTANRGARELLCHSMNGEIDLADLVEGLGRPVNDWLRDAAQGRLLHKREIVQATRADSDVYLQIMLHRVFGNGAVSLIAVLTDATELKSLEAQFAQSQKMEAIGQLAGGIAHDFNNLLTAISGHCDLLLLRHDSGDQDFADIEQIHQNANRAASLVGQLLAFSRKQTLQPETLDLRDTLADLAHLLNRLVGEKVDLTLKHDPGLRPVRADKRQFEQVIMNLVVNARDAVSGGGTILIETANTALHEALRRDRAVVPAGEYVLVRVTDDGSGISSDRIHHVFEPFFTTKKVGEGTGLGLSTAYGIVKQTGGFIFVDSTPGEGTVFTLYLPAQDWPAIIEAPPVNEGAPRDVAVAGEGVVLLVEDEAPVRAFAARALRLRGYTVVEADSAEDALKQLEDPALKVEVFITDVIMPGMDGPSWVKEALQARPEARVVFISGYAEDSITQSRARIANSVFLPKPFTLRELTGIVQTQMEQHDLRFCPDQIAAIAPDATRS